MRTNSFNALNHIKALNAFKNSMVSSGESATKEEFCSIFKSCGIPSNYNFWLEFKNSGLLVKVSKDSYLWESPKPIHHKTLQSIYDRYSKRMNSYNISYRERQKTIVDLNNSKISDAIKLLKSKGYEIYAPYGELYKKL